MRLNPERARHLRDKERGLQRPHPFAPQAGTRKHREIRFAKLPPDQLGRAFMLLARLERLEIEVGAIPYTLSVRYEIEDYTMEGIESALRKAGFHLDSTLYCKLVRALVYYCEDTQLRNMHGPQRLIKNAHHVYSKVWEHHPHGDHDDTPADLRQDH